MSYRRRRAFGFHFLTRLGCLLVLVALLPGCKQRSQASKPDPTITISRDAYQSITGEQGMNVLFVSVDTTRADHLACYGHKEIKTPNIDKLAEQGVLFRTCISSSPLTLVSHSTMLTGSYQFVHGARDNGVFRLSEENVTLPEIFKEVGYRTAAEVATVILDHKYGMNQGFDVYGDIAAIPMPGDLNLDFPLGEDGIPDDHIDRHLEQPREMPGGFLERSAEDITNAGINHLREMVAGDQPFFMFLHYYDPHWPRDSPKEYLDMYEEPYLGEIAYFDAQFGRLIDALDEMGLAEKTLVILTSDHGEGMGQHGEFTHGSFLYDTTLHVPLIMRCKGRLPAGRTVESMVRLVDLAPTILDFFDMSDRRTEQMQGVSLLPLIVDAELDLRLSCYADTIVPKAIFNYSIQRALRTQQWKYIHAPRPELYDVLQDPMELYDLSDPRADLVLDMRQQLYDLIANSPPSPGHRADIAAASPLELSKLRALGYLSNPGMLEDITGGDELDQFEPSGPNPRDHIEEIALISTGLGGLRSGEYEHAEKSLRRLITLEPDHQLATSYLAQALLGQQKYEEAVEWFRRSLELDPQNADDHRSLGYCLGMVMKLDESEAAYRKAIEITPNDYLAMFHLGSLLTLQMRFKEAAEILAAGRAIVPDFAPMLAISGIVAHRLGEMEEAKDLLQSALRADANLVRAHIGLVMVLRESGRVEEAMAHLSEALEQLPDEPLLYYHMSICHRTLGNLDESDRYLLRVVELDESNPIVRIVYATSRAARNELSEAIEHLRIARELAPQSTTPMEHLAAALVGSGEYEEALDIYEDIIEQWPTYRLAYIPAARAAEALNKPEKAIELLSHAMASFPDDPMIANDLAWRLATSSRDELRNGRRAVELARRAAAIAEEKDPCFMDTLAAAYAETGDYDQAVVSAERAIEIAKRFDDKDRIREIGDRLQLYKRSQPYRQD